MIKIITKMFKASKKGIVFNSLTKYVDYEDKTLFYSYPDKIFKYCVEKISQNTSFLKQIIKPKKIRYHSNILWRYIKNENKS